MEHIQNLLSVQDFAEQMSYCVTVTKCRGAKNFPAAFDF